MNTIKILLSVIFPEAHALTPFAWVAGFIALQTGITAYFSNARNCGIYKHFNKQCSSGEIGDRGSLAVAYFDQSLKGKLSLACSKTRDEMRTCIKAYVKQHSALLVVPNELRAYFDIQQDTPYPVRATANGPTGVKN